MGEQARKVCAGKGKEKDCSEKGVSLHHSCFLSLLMLAPVWTFCPIYVLISLLLLLAWAVSHCSLHSMQQPTFTLPQEQERLPGQRTEILTSPGCSQPAGGTDFLWCPNRHAHSDRFFPIMHILTFLRAGNLYWKHCRHLTKGHRNCISTVILPGNMKCWD